MAKTVLTVRKASCGGFEVRYSDGTGRGVSASRDAELIHYTNDGITYKEGGRTVYFDFAKGTKRTF